MVSPLNTARTAYTQPEATTDSTHSIDSSIKRFESDAKADPKSSESDSHESISIRDFSDKTGAEPVECALNRIAYPFEGRKLREDDIGKKVVRVAPVICNSRPDWSYTSSSVDAIDITAIKILKFNEDRTIECEDHSGLLELFLKVEWNDSSWLTVEEFLAKNSVGISSSDIIH